jgi:hypothetical protein
MLKIKDILSMDNFLDLILVHIKQNFVLVVVSYHINKDCHERKTCVYYHNDSDKRRQNFQMYSHELCIKSRCNNDQC